MQPYRHDFGRPQTALYDPDQTAAERLASALGRAGIAVERQEGADEFIAVVRAGDFRTTVVVADLTNPACLRFLERLRSAAPHSWLVVSNAVVDATELRKARRHGVDVLLPAPLDVAELVRRLEALQVRSRPSF
jgi:DNA-binding response OmpR family regulator